MIEIKSFDDLEISGISYGGHGGNKKGIIIDNENWFLKYPQNTKSMNDVNISYSTTPLSEYLGSHIYEMLDIDTHKTMLGIANDKVVVVCKDFLKPNEMILDYNTIKNDYDETLEKELDKIPSSTSSIDSNNNLEEILIIMNSNSYFKKNSELKKRFWIQFVVDAFISNNDRNEGNWGLVLNRDTKETRLAPVYDNGASFYNKADDNKLYDVCNDDFKFKQSVYDSSISIYRLNGKRINPLKYIESMQNSDCNQAICEIVPKIDMNRIKELFKSIPTQYKGYKIISDIQKEMYYKSLEYKYQNVLLPVYNNLKR